MINIFLSSIILVLFIITIVKLYSRMRKTKLSNLRWLIGFFICASMVGIFKSVGTTTTGVGFTISEISYYIVQFLSLFFIIIFTKQTFYKEMHSFFKLIFATGLALSASSFTFAILRLIEYSDMFNFFDIYFLSLTIFIAALWNASASFSAYNLIKEQDINKYVKRRYIIIGISSIVYALPGFYIPLQVIVRMIGPTGLVEITSSILKIFNAVILLIFAVGNFYAWVTLGSKIEKLKAKTLSEPEIKEEDLMKLAREG